MTPQVLLDAFNRRYIDIDQINVIVFDECHHAVADHPYRRVMRCLHEYYENEGSDRPLILGLTASVLNDKGSTAAKIKKALETLEQTFKAVVVGPKEASASTELALHGIYVQYSTRASKQIIKRR